MSVLSKWPTIARLLVLNRRPILMSSSTRSLYLAKADCATSACDMEDWDLTFSIMCKQLAPPLTEDRHKGQSGRIGVFGGCLEYTGAPYFAAISALKVGADIAHVFCMKEAAPVIKSYSPELIVHPYLDDQAAIKKIEPWMDRLHVVLIGPGLGRDPKIFNTITKVIDLCRNRRKPIIIDADGLFYLKENMESIKNYPEPGVVLTPNVVEYQRLTTDVISDSSTRSSKKELDTSTTNELSSNFLFDLGPYITIVKKGPEDEVFDCAKRIKVVGGGSGRRCGGQGDMLAGSLATFLSWALQHKRDLENIHDDRTMIACYAACRLTRECNAAALAKKGRSMTSTDMIAEIGDVFAKFFENHP